MVVVNSVKMDVSNHINVVNMWHCKWCNIDIEDGGLAHLPVPPFDTYDEIEVCPACYGDDELEYIDE